MTLATQLIDTIEKHPLGLCGQHDPARVVTRIPDQEQRLNILALGVILDVHPIQQERWASLVSLAGHWLLTPSETAYQSSRQVQTVMRELRIQAPRHIARVWWQICRGVQGRFQGSWLNLITAEGQDTRSLQAYLVENKTTFPVLAGPVLSARWLDMVHRIGDVQIQGWENLSVPLTTQQEKTARLFGIDRKDIHPVLFSALLVWKQACLNSSSVSCGLDHCPARQ